MQEHSKRGRKVTPPTVKSREGNMEQESDVLVVDPSLWETMTETEREKYFRELLRSRKTFMLDGIKYEPHPNPGPISWSCGGS
jgi:hypothetical protein